MSLPAPYFYDESIFQKERLNIFFRSWHLVAHVNELRTLSREAKKAESMRFTTCANTGGIASSTLTAVTHRRSPVDTMPGRIPWTAGCAGLPAPSV
jgi:hypothetical protein